MVIFKEDTANGRNQYRCHRRRSRLFSTTLAFVEIGEKNWEKEIFLLQENQVDIDS